MSLSLEQLIDVLAQSSGDERARSIVQDECARLRMRFPPSSSEELAKVTAELSRRPGAVGASIRLALRRADPARSTSRGHAVVTEVGSGSHDTVGGAQRLIELLSPALGAARAQSVVHTACIELGLDADWLARDQADRILEHLSSRGDYIAAVARFARAKAMLA